MTWLLSPGTWCIKACQPETYWIMLKEQVFERFCHTILTLKCRWGNFQLYDVDVIWCNRTMPNDVKCLCAFRDLSFDLKLTPGQVWHPIVSIVLKRKTVYEMKYIPKSSLGPWSNVAGVKFVYQLTKGSNSHFKCALHDSNQATKTMPSARFPISECQTVREKVFHHQKLLCTMGQNP